MSDSWDWRNLPRGEPRYHVRFGPGGRIEQHVSYEATNPWHPDDTVARAEYTRKAMERILGGGSMAVRWDSTSLLPDPFRGSSEYAPDQRLAVVDTPGGCPECGSPVIRQAIGDLCTHLDCGWEGS